MRELRVLAAAAALSGTTAISGALAQEEAPLDDGGYVRVGGGATFLSDWTQGYLYNPDQMFITAPAAGQSVANSGGFVAVAAIGFDYADGIRTELEYRYATSTVDQVVIDDPAGPMIGAPAQDDINGHFLMSNFYFDFYNNSPITPYIGGGIGGAFIENENGLRDAALAYQGRAGFSWAMGGGWAADIEYVYLRSKKLVFGPDTDDFTPGGPFEPNISGDRYQSSSVILSLRKKL